MRDRHKEKQTEKKLMNNKKHRLAAGGILGIIVLMLFYIFYLDEDRISDPNAVTITTPGVYETSEDLITDLGRYEEYRSLYQRLKESEEPDHGTYVIPGLNGMKTFNLHTSEIDMCYDMTPQGVAVTADYLIFSAYCHRSDHTSVIVLLDRETGAMVKEIPLEGKPHVGGVAYDGDRQILWVSGDMEGKASVIALTLHAIEAYDSERMQAPIEYTYQELLPELKANSFMTYHEGMLYVGYFRLTGKSTIWRYMVDTDGTLIHPVRNLSIWEKIRNYMRIPAADAFARILPKIQGISFVRNQLLMTQSYGPSDSSLFVSDETDLINGDNNLTKKHIIERFTYPGYLESACYYEEENKVYFLFEGGARSYRWKASVPMDRIICLDLDD